jgi:ribose transport system permease protein
MMTIARSLAMYYADAGAMSGFNSKYSKIGNEYLFGIPIPVMIFAVIFVLAFIVLEKTVFGRHIYAVGGNTQAARLSAISEFKIPLSSIMNVEGIGRIQRSVALYSARSSVFGRADR